MPVIISELNISCIWNGILAGILLKNDALGTGEFKKKTTKIIGIHGWLDNLNSLLPLAKQLVDRHPNYEIYLYDRAGHGFSSHIPKGFDYSVVQNMLDLRTVIRTLEWNKEKFCIIGHSYGSMLATVYAASYPDEVLCLVAIDALIRARIPSDSYWRTIGSDVVANLQHLSRLSNTRQEVLTFEKAVELTKTTRHGISNEAASLLTERLVRRDSDNQLHFTRDESSKILPSFPFTDILIQNMIKTIKASILFIGVLKPQWPAAHISIGLFKQYHPRFEMTFIDGPHHLHMTHVNEVVECIEQHFNKYLHHSFISMIENSKL